MATWAYRKGDNGETEAKIFEEMPEGWVDSPAKVDEAPKKRGRPKKGAGE